MPILTEHSFELARFTPELADAFGQVPGEEGCRLIESAAQNGRSRVAIRDWLYCLAQQPWTITRRQLVDVQRKAPEKFINSIESGFDDEFMTDLPPARLTSACVTPEVQTLLQHAESLAVSAGLPVISDGALTLAILEKGGDDLQEMLKLWMSEDGLERLINKLRRDLVAQPVATAEVFRPDGALNRTAFSQSAFRVISRIVDDAASIGVKQLTTRHVLYTLLSNDSGPLSLAMSVQGVNVKTDVHAVLVRELRRVGSPKRSEYQLTRTTCFAPVVRWFERARDTARDREAECIGEGDLHRAFAEIEFREMQRLLPVDHPFNQSAFVEYVKSAVLTGDDDNATQTADGLPSMQSIQSGIQSRIFGQEAAISRVIPWIKRLRFGLPREGRPAGVFLFVGPTGTGKTQLAREIARLVYGDEDRLLFLEMGQFKTTESMSMLIGAPPGYIGYGDGKLTNGLRENPECVVLFDEIEKAHTQVFDVILRFADEGLISDPAGPVRDGRRCIIVLTTNAGQAWLRTHLANHPEAVSNAEELTRKLFDAAMKELSDKGFRPEFLARVDERLTFLPLSLSVCRSIVEAALTREFEKFQTHKQVTVRATPQVIEHLAQQAVKRTSDEGARAVPRIVNELLITPLIDLLVDATSEHGGQLPGGANIGWNGRALTLELAR